MTARTILDHIRDLEERIAALEANQGSGLSGTDQTIKGCHDRLDTLLGAGVSTPGTTLVTNLNADLLDSLHALTSGASAHVVATTAAGDTQLDGALTLNNQLKTALTSSGVIRAAFVKATISDNTATAVFTITTANETGDADAGTYSVFIKTHAAHSSGTTSSYLAAMPNLSAFSRAVEKTGTGVTSTVKDYGSGASAATSSASKDVASVTVTTTETSEYVLTVEVTIDLSGAAVTNGFCVMIVELAWYGFTTAPVIAAA